MVFQPHYRSPHTWGVETDLRVARLRGLISTGKEQMAKFKKGRSGNPKGRPKGIPDKRTALRAMLEPHGSALVSKAVQLALDGDTTALRLCLERIIPPVKSRDQPVTLGKLGDTLTDQARAVTEAAAAGQVTPSEAAALIQALSGQARIMEIDELERRVTQLEKAFGAS